MITFSQGLDADFLLGSLIIRFDILVMKKRLNRLFLKRNAFYALEINSFMLIFQKFQVRKN